jgi:mevalonate kinase
VKLLKAIAQLVPKRFERASFYMVSDTNFYRSWGLGTSATLITNLAKWAGCDPFALNTIVSKGSGYDIATALHGKPLLYQLNNGNPEIQFKKFDPEFRENIFYLYLNTKQQTESSLQSFLQNNTMSDSDVQQISSITSSFVESHALGDAMKLLTEHEEIMGRLIGQQPVKKRLFADFNGAIKSLGAWGGDFAMVLSSESKTYIETFFKQRGFSTLISYNDMIVT